MQLQHAAQVARQESGQSVGEGSHSAVNRQSNGSETAGKRQENGRHNIH
jgi:hypothetical protein